jgi:hypothetical protein
MLITFGVILWAVFHGGPERIGQMIPIVVVTLGVTGGLAAFMLVRAIKRSQQNGRIDP